MKAAMLTGQEAEDEKLSWRVDAEVRLRLDEVRQQETARSAALQVLLLFPSCVFLRSTFGCGCGWMSCGSTKSLALPPCKCSSLLHNAHAARSGTVPS